MSGRRKSEVGIRKCWELCEGSGREKLQTSSNQTFRTSEFRSPTSHFCTVPDSLAKQLTETPDTPFDISLRPPMFSEFTGQEKVCQRLELMVQAAQQRGDVLEHILLSGPPGL